MQSQEELSKQTIQITLAPNPSQKVNKQQQKKVRLFSILPLIDQLPYLIFLQNKKKQQTFEKMQSIDEANKNVVSDRKIEITELQKKLTPLRMTIKEVLCLPLVASIQ